MSCARVTRGRNTTLFLATPHNLGATQKAPDPFGSGPCVKLEIGEEEAAQALGLRPWLAALPLRERRLRARLLMSAPISGK
jgi:hypothetical protein